MRKTLLLAASLFAAGAACAKTASLTPADLLGNWRLSAVSTAKYGCDNPGAMTVEFVRNTKGDLLGKYTGPGMPGVAEQRYVLVANFETILQEQSAKGRAITLDAPGALRRVFAVETLIGADGRPVRLEWSSIFGGIGEETSVYDTFVPSAWLTRC